MKQISSSMAQIIAIVALFMSPVGYGHAASYVLKTADLEDASNKARISSERSGPKVFSSLADSGICKQMETSKCTIDCSDAGAEIRLRRLLGLPVGSRELIVREPLIHREPSLDVCGYFAFSALFFGGPVNYYFVGDSDILRPIDQPFSTLIRRMSVGNRKNAIDARRFGELFVKLYVQNPPQTILISNIRELPVPLSAKHLTNPRYDFGHRGARFRFWSTTGDTTVFWDILVTSGDKIIIHQRRPHRCLIHRTVVSY